MRHRYFQEADNRADFDGEVPSSSRDIPTPSPRPLWSGKSNLSSMAVISPILSPGHLPSTPLSSVDSGDEERQGSTASLPATPNGKRARIRLFPQKWLGDYSWLAYDAAEKTMHCRLCKELGKKTLMGMSGTKNFRTRTLTDHALSADHQHAVAAREQRQTWLDVTIAKNTDSLP